MHKSSRGLSLGATISRNSKCEFNAGFALHPEPVALINFHLGTILGAIVRCPAAKCEVSSFAGRVHLII